MTLNKAQEEYLAAYGALSALPPERRLEFANLADPVAKTKPSGEPAVNMRAVGSFDSRPNPDDNGDDETPAARQWRGDMKVTDMSAATRAEYDILNGPAFRQPAPQPQRDPYTLSAEKLRDATPERRLNLAYAVETLKQAAKEANLDPAMRTVSAHAITTARYALAPFLAA